MRLHQKSPAERPAAIAQAVAAIGRADSQARSVPSCRASASAKTAAARGSRPKADPSAAASASAKAAPAESAPAPTSLPGGVFGGKPF